MRNRSNLLTRAYLIASSAALLAVSAATAQTGADARPNIILIMADDIGYECYGAYGGTSYQTPVIDRLAAQGLRFTHAYANPICTPTRVKLMTGRSNVRNYSAFSVLKKSERTFGHMMREAGYRTAIAGKWQLYGAEHYSPRFRSKGSLPQDTGFERHCLWQVDKLGSRYWGPTVTIDGAAKQFGKNVYGPDVYSQFLLDRMEEFKDEPFFLYYPMALVHSPFEPTPDSKPRKPIAKALRKAMGPKIKQQNFADMVAYMDKIIGRIVAKTEALGIADRTLILVTGDNGTHTSIRSKLGEVVVRGGKGKPTDAGTHVALVAYQPGAVPKGKTSDTLVEFSDFVPTLAQTAKIDALNPTDGVSFHRQLHGQSGSAREHLFVYYWPRPEKGAPVRFVRDHRWKLYGDGRLVDVANDIREKNPIAHGQQEAVRQRLQTFMDTMPAKGQSLLQY